MKPHTFALPGHALQAQADSRIELGRCSMARVMCVPLEGVNCDGITFLLHWGQSLVACQS